ncbi:MAG: phosphoglycerate dehydrogenase [Gammaproteobacteria bacterium]
MFSIQTFNNIAVAGLARFPEERYDVGPDAAEPDAILVRSADLHGFELPASLKAVGRAGSGTNNIPVAALTARGIPVFNAPGANANAVKELVVAGILIAARNLTAAWDFARTADADIESAKKRFAGFELPGRTLGVIGLGAIGVEVCNAAHALGMRVIGFDPKLTVQRAWQLSASVEQARSLEELLGRCDFVSVHVPLTDQTRDLLDAPRLAYLRRGAVVLNMARGGIVNTEAVLDALASGRVHAYVTDFPDARFSGHAGIIAFPHLGASTLEAEENCAVQVADTVREFLEHGVLRHSVNFPDADLAAVTDGWRIAIANANVPNMVGQITATLGSSGLNIIDMLNRSRGDVAWTVVDLDSEVDAQTLAAIHTINGVLSARVIGPGDSS